MTTHNLLIDPDLNYWTDDDLGPPLKVVVSDEPLDALYAGDLQSSDLAPGPVNTCGNYRVEEEQ